MKNLILSLFVVLSFTSCQKEELEIVQPMPPGNTSYEIYAMSSDGIGASKLWTYFMYETTDSNGVNATDKLVAAYNAWQLVCIECDNEDMFTIYCMDTSLVSNPDAVVISSFNYVDIPSVYFNDANSPLGDGRFYLYPHDMSDSYNNLDQVTLY